jgi:hypothetical protein
LFRLQIETPQGSLLRRSSELRHVDLRAAEHLAGARAAGHEDRAILEQS